MRFAPLVIAVFSTPVLAGTPIDKMRGSIGKAAMESDRVDVVLYGAPDGFPYPGVQVTIGEDQYLFQLASGSPHIHVGPRVVQDQGLKVREGNKKLVNIRGKDAKHKLGGEQKYTQIETIQIGGLLLSDVVASTLKGSSFGGGDTFDGIIGLGALPTDLGWAIRPSVGQVSFAQGEAINGLASGGISVPYVNTKSFKYKYGVRVSYEDAHSLIVEADIGGVSTPTILDTSASSSHYKTETPNPAEVNDRDGDIFLRYHAVSLAESSVGSLWMGEFTALPEAPQKYRAVLGMNALHRFDIAVNPGVSAVTLTEVAAPKWNDPRPFLLAQARKAVEPSADADGDEQSATADESSATGEDAQDEKPPGNPGAWHILAKLYQSTGDLDNALEALTNAVAFDERSCTNWMALGNVQRLAGDMNGAAESYGKAADLYHAWFDLDLERRNALKKEHDKMDAEEKEASEHHPSDASCHTADGDLAATKFALGELGEVEQLYEDRFDLDTQLALVAANTLITKGEYAAAQAPLRQALKQQQGDRSWTRLALAMVYANSGDWSQASLLFDRSLADNASTQSAKVWLDAMTAAQGPDAALAAVQKMVQEAPESTVAQYALAYMLQDTEDQTGRNNARKQGEVVFSKRLAKLPRSGVDWSRYARWLTLMGETEQAEEAANKAMGMAPGKALSYISLAEVYAAKEDPERAREFTKKAAQAEPRHPGYAQLMNTIAPSDQ